MNSNILRSSGMLPLGNDLLSSAANPQLESATSSGLQELIEQMGQQPIALAFQDVVNELTPSKSFVPPSPLQVPGLNPSNTTPVQSYSPKPFSINPNSNAVDQLTGQIPGHLRSANSAIDTSPLIPEQIAVLWGVDSHNGQLFQLKDHEQTSPELVDYGNLVVSSSNKIYPLKKVSAFTIDSDNQSAYIAVNRKVGSLKSPWIGKIDLSAVQEEGSNEVTVVGSIDLRSNEDRRATIRGLDFDPVTGELYALLT